jgi:hypothetical protein
MIAANAHSTRGGAPPGAHRRGVRLLFTILGIGLSSSPNMDKKVVNWAAIHGRWRFEGEEARYLGPQPPELGRPGNPFGISVSDRRFSEGTVKTNVRLPADGSMERRISIDTSAYFMLGYRALEQEYFLVGLAGYESAYAISRYVPGRAWIAVATAGSRENLSPDTEYQLIVRVEGQRIVLSVNGIRVLEHVLPTPFEEAQLGLAGWGAREVVFRDIALSPERGKVFVVMQFSAPYQELYTDVIQPLCEKAGLEAYHAGEFFGPGVILDDIVRSIVEAKIVIAEIAAPNQNVFYELGYAHALKKPTILLAEHGKTLPFDVSGYRCLFYENSIGGKQKVVDALDKHLKAILHE